MKSAGLVEAAQQLSIEPTARPWGHLGLAITDAVFSIGIRYEHTLSTVKRYAAHEGLVAGYASQRASGIPEQTLSEFLATLNAHTPDFNAKSVFGNSTRTSTHANSILKAEAVVQFANVLVANKIETYEDVNTLLVEEQRLESIDAELNRIPGSGVSRVRSGYFWMLIGDENVVKPDRHILRWLNRHSSHTFNVSEARSALADLAGALGVTARDLDHAIWDVERSRK